MNLKPWQRLRKNEAKRGAGEGRELLPPTASPTPKVASLYPPPVAQPVVLSSGSSPPLSSPQFLDGPPLLASSVAASPSESGETGSVQESTTEPNATGPSASETISIGPSDLGTPVLKTGVLGTGVLGTSALGTGAIGFEFNMPKSEGQGEDADPLALWQGDRGILAVFDGMGGAGSLTYQRFGVAYTGAYIASRVVREEMRRLFSPAFPLPAVPVDAVSIRESLARSLSREATELEIGAEPSRLKSKLLRRLPTTMAALCIVQNGARALCQTLWAGDSRAYVLSPSYGLQQLTLDDLKVRADALENLKGDSPLSNCLSADGDFVVRSQTHEVSLPSVLVTATDGCFGYLFSPAHFEFLLLDTLQETNDAQAWGRQVAMRLRSIAGDDCSMALLAIGWASYHELKSSFTGRHQMLQREYVAPLDSLSAEIERDSQVLRQTEARKVSLEQTRQEMRDQLWMRYKALHDQLLEPCSEPPKE